MFKITKAQIMHLLAVPIALLSGWCATLVGNNIPGVHLTSGWLAGIFTTALAGAIGLAIHYLHGWQLWERTVGKVVEIEGAKQPTGTGAKKTY